MKRIYLKFATIFLFFCGNIDASVNSGYYRLRDYVMSDCLDDVKTTPLPLEKPRNENFSEAEWALLQEMHCYYEKQSSTQERPAQERERFKVLALIKCSIVDILHNKVPSTDALTFFLTTIQGQIRQIICNIWKCAGDTSPLKEVVLSTQKTVTFFVLACHNRYAELVDMMLDTIIEKKEPIEKVLPSLIYLSYLPYGILIPNDNIYSIFQKVEKHFGINLFKLKGINAFSKEGDVRNFSDFVEYSEENPYSPEPAVNERYFKGRFERYLNWRAKHTPPELPPISGEEVEKSDKKANALKRERDSAGLRPRDCPELPKKKSVQKKDRDEPYGSDEDWIVEGYKPWRKERKKEQKGKREKRKLGFRTDRYFLN